MSSRGQQPPVTQARQHRRPITPNHPFGEHNPDSDPDMHRTSRSGNTVTINDGEPRPPSPPPPEPINRPSTSTAKIEEVDDEQEPREPSEEQIERIRERRLVERIVIDEENQRRYEQEVAQEKIKRLQLEYERRKGKKKESSESNNEHSETTAPKTRRKISRKIVRQDEPDYSYDLTDSGEESSSIGEFKNYDFKGKSREEQ